MEAVDWNGSRKRTERTERMEEDGEGERFDLVIPEESAGRRLDKAVQALLPERSRAFVKKLFERGCITLSGPGPAAKPALRVRGGERVVVFVPAALPLELEAQALPLDVLYEDDELVVVDKRPGMVAHPSQGHRDGTLVNALLHHYGDGLSEIGGVLRPGIVHRLDRDTSGCLVAAKTDRAHAALMRQFMEREVGKTYLAVTERAPRPLSGKVEGNIGRSVRDRKVHAMLRTGGRYSLTEYRTLEDYGLLALVECRLHTGRTHQARVHMIHAGARILCDAEYGGSLEFREGDRAYALSVMTTGAGDRRLLGTGRVLLSRQALHASELSFRHPVDGRPLHFTAPFPADMSRVLEPFRAARSAGTATEK